MLPVLKDQRENARLKVNLFLHIYNEGRIFSGKSVDLSSWGIRFKTLQTLESGDLVKLSFVYKTSYILNTKIVEKISDGEYRGIFIFDNLSKKIMLESNI